MSGPRAMAAFATDINFGPAGVIAIALLGIILLQSGGVAGGTLSIPVVVNPCPVQAFPWLPHVIRHKLIPALTALLCWPAIPGDCQCLIATVGKANKILLQRFNAKGVGDFKRLVIAIRTLSADIIFAVLAGKAGGQALMTKAGIVKVSEHRIYTGFAHCPVMVGALPLLIFRGMAAPAGVAADIIIQCLTGIACQSAKKKDCPEG